MRLWHKDLIPVLPDKQLLGQWRECCAIAKNIATKGTPNHLLVNKIMNYPSDHFWSYGSFVAGEMLHRGFAVDFEKFNKYFPFGGYALEKIDDIFKGWHNKRYMSQCFMNLQEKFDCGGIKAEDYNKICDCCKEVFIDLRYAENKQVVACEYLAGTRVDFAIEDLTDYERQIFLD